MYRLLAVAAWLSPLLCIGCEHIVGLRDRHVAEGGGGASASASSAGGGEPDITCVPDAVPERFSDAVVADAPTGYWPLDDEASGEVVRPVSARLGPDAEGHAIAFGEPGAVDGGSCGYVNGTGYIETEGFDLGSGSFTVELWAKLQSWDLDYQWLAEQGTDGADRTGVRLYAHELGTTFVRSLDGENVGSAVAPPLEPGRWTHVAVTYDTAEPEPSRTRIYVDGDLAARGPGHRNVSTNTALEFARYFVGHVDELVVYEGALSCARIRTHYLAGR